MAELNELILKKLKEYPIEVAEVAAEAVRLSAIWPKRAVEEHLHDVLRQAIRGKGKNR